MKFSIVVPVYNAENTLERCIESIIAQQIKSDIEIILVEDYSQDDSLNICYALEKKFQNIKVLRTCGKGVSAARNTGLDNSTGDVIGFCDSDDVYEKDVLCEIEKQFKLTEDIDLVIGGYFYSEFEGGKIHIEERFSFRNNYIVDYDTLYNLMINDERVLGSVCNKFYRSKYIGEMRFQTDISYCEDLYFNVELLSKRAKVSCLILGQPIYHYIHNKCSATNSMERLFDSKDELKYIVTLRRLRGYVDEKYKKIVGYKIVTIAVDFLYHNNLTDAKERFLIENISLYSNDFKKMTVVNYRNGSWKWIVKKSIIFAKKSIRRKADDKN